MMQTKSIINHDLKYLHAIFVHLSIRTNFS